MLLARYPLRGYPERVNQQTPEPRNPPSPSPRGRLSVSRLLLRLLGGQRPRARPGEVPLLAFVSSVMRPELQWARDETVHTFDRARFLVPWAFEFTPASSEPVDQGYLRKVREADMVVWLVGEETTEPVQNEIREALAIGRRLLVMKLPVARREGVTESLIAEVGNRARWMEVSAAGRLREALELTLGDEIVRAMRGKPGLGRLARLEEVGRASRGRCAMRWQAADVPRMVALDLADDQLIGSPDRNLRPSSDRPVIVVVGEIGAGKSLIAERLLQDAISSARDDASAPVPVYLEAHAVVGTLRDAVVGEVTGLGDPSVQGAAVVVDGADEAGSAAAVQLLNEARVIVERWPRTTVVLTARPIPPLATEEEAEQVPLLPEAEAFALIGRLAGRPITTGLAWTWPESVRDAVRRPLFSILLGTYLAATGLEGPPSVGELLSSLVDRALGRAAADRLSAENRLHRLAALVIDRGGPVPEADVGTRDEIAQLLDSRLVVEQQGVLTFPLPILTEWFAAQGLSQGSPPSADLAANRRRLEQWRFPLVTAVATLGHDAASRILDPIVENDPAFAGQIVGDAISRFRFGQETPLAPALACGERVRAAMEVWAKAIGPLGSLIAPLGPDSRLRPLGVYLQGGRLTTSWYAGEADVPDVADLAVYDETFRDADSFAYRGGPPASQPAWAWGWALDDLVGQLSDLLQRRRLPVEEGSVARESIWQTALTIMGRGSLDPRPISVEELGAAIARLPARGTVIRSGRRLEVPGCDVALLTKEVERLKAEGAPKLTDPWPPPDRDALGGGWVWDRYTAERMLERTRAVYAGALEGYSKMVEAWFPRFASRLRMAVTLPARLVGEITPARQGRGLGGGPSIRWYLEPLPEGSADVVDFRLGEPTDEVDLQSLQTRLRSARPEASQWIYPAAHYEILDVFHANSATELAYDWLWRDLENVSWVRGGLGRR